MMTFRTMNSERKEVVCVIGLGYVGLPLARLCADQYDVIGYDIDERKIEQLSIQSGEGSNRRKIEFTSSVKAIAKASIYIIAVPTDVTDQQLPDLQPLQQATNAVASELSEGDLVIYEATVYPGCTEELCVPLLEKGSGLKVSQEFDVGYSPERIVPGDTRRTLVKVNRIVAGIDPRSTTRTSRFYQSILTSEIHEVSMIRVAEAAKMLENVQRDLNISLMNEFALIMHRLHIDTSEVIEAARTKWNFHAYKPGLVGGHCISVDPHYMIYKAKQLGIDPEVIAAGRRVNDSIPKFIVKSLVQKLIKHDKNPGHCRVLILGLTFKENVADTRNSKVFDLISELEDYSIATAVYDPHVKSNQLTSDRIELAEVPLAGYDAVIAAVAHDQFREFDEQDFLSMMSVAPILMDVKGMYPSYANVDYWRL